MLQKLQLYHVDIMKTELNFKDKHALNLNNIANSFEFNIVDLKPAYIKT